MTRIEKEVEDYFDNCGEFYDDFKDLHVMGMIHGDGVFVSAPWPGVADKSSLVLCFVSSSYAEFIEAFLIKGSIPRAIERITAQNLMGLFVKGRASVDCEVGGDDEDQMLSFRRKMDGKMLATDIYDTEHELSHWLEEPEQFLSYTRQYYKIDRRAMEYLFLNFISVKKTVLTKN